MNKSDDKLLDEILRKIGRNILILQQIEKRLKIILPFISPDTRDQGIDSFRKYNKTIQSQTLGHLINAFLNYTNYDHNYFAESLKNIIANRNKLVHGLEEFGNLKLLYTEEGCRNYISHLDLQHQEIFAFYKDIQLYFCVLIYIFKEHYAKEKPELKLLYESIKSKLPFETEYINLDNPSDTIWKNTQIVKLLLLAEANTKKINDMTSLSLAGKFIKNRDPECTTQKYGIKTLKGVLKASGLFEIIESKKNDSHSFLVLYKSKFEH